MMIKSLLIVALSTSMFIAPTSAASNCMPSIVDVQQQSSPLEAQVADGSLLYKGVDWSSLIVEERDNDVVYKDNKGVVKPLENILVEAGVNFVRQRVWTVEGDYGIDYNIQLAKRAWKAGLQFGLNLHFSDTWTNPEQQDIPSGWPTDIDQLEERLWSYVTEVAETFNSEGLIPRTITIGNEIPTGLLWPTGHIDNPENLSRLLHTAAQAVRQSSLGPTTKVLTHLAHGFNKELQNWFYDLVLAPGYFKLED